MNKVFAFVGAAALLGASSIAALAEEASGMIQSVDATAMTVTLDDGNTYVLPASADAAALQPGQQIKIQFEQGSDGTLQATAVEPAG